MSDGLPLRARAGVLSRIQVVIRGLNRDFVAFLAICSNCGRDFAPVRLAFGQRSWRGTIHMIRHIIVAGAIFAIASVSSAGVWIFNDPVNEALVNPPTGVAATGTAFGSYDDVTNMLDITVLASGFVSPRTLAHVHGPATPEQNNGVQLNLGVAGSGGDYNNPFRLHTLTGLQENEFLAGLYYVNIHTEDNPGGAIRGQLNPVPEPASMIALGLGTLVLLRRRMKL